MNGSAAIKVLGDSGDQVALQGNWVLTENDTVNGFMTYQLDGSKAIVKTGIVTTVTLSGTARNDSLIAGAGSQIVQGLAGGDTLGGGVGDDTLFGGSGADKLIYDPEDSVIDGQTGDDTLLIQGGNVTLDLTTVSDSVIAGIEIFLALATTP
jgi:Ca2+-binding RTX toxin-like protein